MEIEDILNKLSKKNNTLIFSTIMTLAIEGSCSLIFITPEDDLDLKKAKNDKSFFVTKGTLTEQETVVYLPNNILELYINLYLKQAQINKCQVIIDSNTNLGSEFRETFITDIYKNITIVDILKV